MTTQPTQKKRIVISYHNLPAQLQEELKRCYPLGFTDHMIRVDKGPADFFYAVDFETAEARYLVKVDVKIDNKPEEEEDKEYYDEEIKGAEEIADNNEESDED
jgi:hypothetical protein